MALKSRKTAQRQPAAVFAQSGGQLPADYRALLEDLKARIRTSQVKAALSVNRQLIELYLDIGRRILEQQAREGWGKFVVERLSQDLRREFPDLKGFSPRNLWDMRRLYETVADRPILRQLVAEIPWGHNLLLLNSLQDPAEREWYIRQTQKHGWSRSILEVQIESGLYKRQGKAVTNFSRALPPPQSDLAQQITKDPYVFDFLSLREDYNERALEQGLLDHVQKFLLELGAGFSLVGRQVHLEVEGDDFYIDLLFYHLKLRCFVVVDLKARAFIPEYAGKMNFYLSAVDDLLRHPDDKPSIGLILCKSQNKVAAEYALRDIVKPIGVSGYVTRLVESLPRNLKDALPSPEQIEKELSRTEASDIESEKEAGKRKSSRKKK